MLESYSEDVYVFVSIILPSFNEEKAIGKVINDVRSSMKQTMYSFEIIVVDDVSSDATPRIAAENGVRVIRRKRRGGSGASRKTGILHARGEIIVMLDADDTYTAEDIPTMLSYFPEYDQVNGARTPEQGTLKFLRMPAKWFIRKLACYLTGFNIPDLNTGLKAFKKDIMKKYLWVIPDGFSCVTTMTLAFLTNGYAVKYIPTTYKKRLGVSKFHPIKDTFKYLQTVARMIMYFNPMKIFLPFSLIILCAGIVKSIYDRFFGIHYLQASDIIILVLGVNILMFGLIADLIVARGKQSDYEK